jgi:ketosteroid isomerase-like protein
MTFQAYADAIEEGEIHLETTEANTPAELRACAELFALVHEEAEWQVPTTHTRAKVRRTTGKSGQGNVQLSLALAPVV